MNRKHTIIVSVSGIFIVTLILLGLTYAYFLTRINGNTNDKSISVTTDKLELTYEDGNGQISGTNIMPGTTLTSKTFSVKNNGSDTSYIVVLEDVTVKDSSNNTTTFESNDFTYTLTCTTKSGSSCNNEITEKTILPLSDETLINNYIAKNETQNYTLTITYNETGVDQSADMGKILSAKVNIKDPIAENPYRNNKNSLAYNIINNSINRINGTEFRIIPKTKIAEETPMYKPGKVIERELLMRNSWFFGATDYSARPWEGNRPEGTSNECNDTIIGKYISYYPLSKSLYVKACKGSKVAVVEGEIFPENILSIAPDEYGTSYYYRGAVKDNYLELNNVCFRIVRIEGDGSIKVTLANDGPCSKASTSSGVVKDDTGSRDKRVVYGHDDKYNFNYEGYEGGLYTTLKDWYNSKMVSVQDKLKNESWCLGEKISRYDMNTGMLLNETSTNTKWYYETGKRLEIDKQATYKCSNEADKITEYVGTLTADEVAYAGETTVIYYDSNRDNARTYLNDQAQLSGYSYWLLSRTGFGEVYGSNEVHDDVYAVYSGSGYSGLSIQDIGIIDDNAVRPAVTIATGAELASGDGTQSNPYTIK